MRFITVKALDITGGVKSDSQTRELRINADFIKAIVGRSMYSTEEEPLAIHLGKKVYSQFEVKEFAQQVDIRGAFLKVLATKCSSDGVFDGNAPEHAIFVNASNIIGISDQGEVLEPMILKLGNQHYTRLHLAPGTLPNLPENDLSKPLGIYLG